MPLSLRPRSLPASQPAKQPSGHVRGYGHAYGSIGSIAYTNLRFLFPQVSGSATAHPPAHPRHILTTRLALATSPPAGLHSFTWLSNGNFSLNGSSKVYVNRDIVASNGKTVLVILIMRHISHISAHYFQIDCFFIFFPFLLKQ